MRIVKFMYPLKEITVTQSFGANFKTKEGKLRYDPYHHGTDLRTRTSLHVNGIGTPIHSIQEGKVVRAYNSTTYGLCVVVEHVGKAKGFWSLYAHLSEIKVKNGDLVHAGTLVGLSGSTGASLAAHLHIELRWKDNLLHNTVDLFNHDNPKNFVKDAPMYTIGTTVLDSWEEEAKTWAQESGLITDWSKPEEPMSQMRIAAFGRKLEIYLKDKYKL